MAKCYGCGKQGLFLKVRDGFCADCFAKYSKSTQSDCHQTTTQSFASGHSGSAKDDVAKQYLNRVLDRHVQLPTVIGNQVVVYSYPGVYVSNVNHNVLKYMCELKKYRVTAHIAPDGHIALQYDGAIVGFLNQKEMMCKDWLSRGDIILCEFVSFQPGFEQVAISFYRDEQARLSNRDSTIAKLTLYSPADIQHNLHYLSTGEKLSCCEDFESDKVCVYDSNNNLIGCLPKQFEDQFDDFAGIFFDHSERSESRDHEIPYVKIYL